MFKSLATFNKFKLYPSVVNNKIENLRTICSNSNKYSEEKQASLKLRPALAMLTALVRSYTDMHRISYHSFLAFLNPANSREHVHT
jgi:hypothetical protein